MNHPNCHLRCPDYFLFTNALFGGPKCVDKSCGRCQLVTLLRPQNITKRSSKLAHFQLNFVRGKPSIIYLQIKYHFSWKRVKTTKSYLKAAENLSISTYYQIFQREFDVYVLLSPCGKALFVLCIIGWLRWPQALFYLLIAWIANPPWYVMYLFN